MRLELTEEQFQSLLKLIYMGKWVADAVEHQTDNDQSSKDFAQLEQLIFKEAGKNGFSDWVEVDEESGAYYPSSILDEDKIVAGSIDAYEENCFWDELIDRLCIRDMIANHGIDKIADMTHQERYEKEKELVNRYENEFHDFGLKRLVIDKEHDIDLHPDSQ